MRAVAKTFCVGEVVDCDGLASLKAVDRAIDDVDAASLSERHIEQTNQVASSLGPSDQGAGDTVAGHVAAERPQRTPTYLHHGFISRGNSRSPPSCSVLR